MSEPRASVHTTGVGSIPFTDLGKALDHVFASYSVPFLPELPRGSRHGLSPMVARVLPASVLEAVAQRDDALLLENLGDASESAAQAEMVLRSWPELTPFLARAQGTERIKLQIAGPKVLSDSLSHLAPTLPASELLEAVWTWSSTLSRALVAKATQETEAHVLLIWDEPTLTPSSAKQFGDAYRRAFGAIPSTRTRAGIHCCNDVPLEALCQLTQGHVLSIDLSVSDFMTETGRTAATLHLDRGGLFILGIFDTRLPKIDPEEGATKGRDAFDVLSASKSFHEVLLSGGCGTGTKSEVYEEVLAAGLAMVSGVMRVL